MLSGTSLVLQHYRFNRECNVLEELAPVDMNLHYHTDYQVSMIFVTHHEINVCPISK